MAGWKPGGVQSCEDLVEAYRRQREAAGAGAAVEGGLAASAMGRSPVGAAEKIRFAGADGRDVYNITAPFEDEGVWVIAGRVERRDSEQSEVWFFVLDGERWVPKPGAPTFALQDPFVTRIAGELIFGGVQTFPHPVVPGATGWRTVFYRGPSLAKLTPFFQGPDQMKDLRLVELGDGGIGVFTRPQGEKGGRGKIGFTRVPSLAELTVEAVEMAPLLAQFRDEEWGGSNEIHRLADGRLGVLGHIARFDDRGDRHYYPMVFVVNPATGAYSEMKIIAERADFAAGEAKRPDLADVVFSGGLLRRGDGTAELYAGISDAEAQKLIIRDPFAD